MNIHDMLLKKFSDMLAWRIYKAKFGGEPVPSGPPIVTSCCNI